MIYAWQHAAWADVQSMISESRLPHALLLKGAKGIGKQHFAKALAKRQLCSNPQQFACDQCKSCDLFDSQNHPDVFFLEPEEVGKQIKIDGVRAAAEFISKTSQQGGAKMLIVSPAESMNHYAANALLKTLEEPPENNLILLVTHHLLSLLPTIRSRCQRLNLASPSEEDAHQWLQAKNIPDEHITPGLLLANNQPLLATQLLEQGAVDTYQTLLSIVETLDVRKDNYVQLVGKVNVSDFDLIVRCLGVWICDLIHWNTHKNAQYLVDKNMLAFYQKHTPSLESLFFLHAKLLESKQLSQSTANINRQLLLENLMIDWMHCLR